MITLSAQQQEALQQIEQFLADEKAQIFILKGYAGTGKTTMIKAILPKLEDYQKRIKLMGPTGRAAKVLRDKTGYEAKTIHSTIYKLDELKEARHDKNGKKIESAISTKRDTKDDDCQFYFDIKILENEEPSLTPREVVSIIDEASMISSRESRADTLHFGTDVLMNDLLTYTRPKEGGKIIFVGDPAQLPPVGDNNSMALSEEFFTKKGFDCKSYELTEVQRQAGDSAILKNAMKIRGLLNTNIRGELCFDRAAGEVEDIEQTKIAEAYTERVPKPTIGESIIICYSNAKVKYYNDRVRFLYHGGRTTPQPSDVMMVVKNNSKLGLFNGDFLQAIEISDNTETLSAPVWTTVGEERKQIWVKMTFRDIKATTYDGRTIECKIIENLLNNDFPALTPLETTALFISFRLRHPELTKPKDIKEGLLDDPYFNALCVKYGYAITCHKSQGGEWDTAFVDYNGRTGLNNDCLRWAYTATTRAAKRLYGADMPRMGLLDKMKVEAIKKAKSATKNALSVANNSEVEFLPANATNSQRAKYLSAEKELEEMGMCVTGIDCLQYVDRYHVATEKGERVFDLYYNGTGMYTRINPLVYQEGDEEIVRALRSTSEYLYKIDYLPENITLEKLHSRMQSYCDELEIDITNITKANYQVTYHLKTSGSFASISFSYSGKGVISYAAPLGELGQEDDKLAALVAKLG